MAVSNGHISKEDVLQQLRETDERFLTATEIAEQLDVDRQIIHYRLQKLLDEGAVHRKQAGSRAVGWWPAEN